MTLKLCNANGIFEDMLDIIDEDIEDLYDDAVEEENEIEQEVYDNLILEDSI